MRAAILCLFFLGVEEQEATACTKAPPLDDWWLPWLRCFLFILLYYYIIIIIIIVVFIIIKLFKIFFFFFFFDRPLCCLLPLLLFILSHIIIGIVCGVLLFLN